MSRHSVQTFVGWGGVTIKVNQISSEWETDIQNIHCQYLIIFLLWVGLSTYKTVQTPYYDGSSDVWSLVDKRMKQLSINGTEWSIFRSWSLFFGSFQWDGQSVGGGLVSQQPPGKWFRLQSPTYHILPIIFFFTDTQFAHERHKKG